MTGKTTAGKKMMMIMRTMTTSHRR
jgi:hypothetical protein